MDFYLKVKRLNDTMKNSINFPAKPGDAGYDVFSTVNSLLQPGERLAVPLGIALEFPEGFVCKVEQKSGISQKLGLDTIGNVIDSGYRGQIHAVVVNTSNYAVSIHKDEKIAQLVFYPYVKAKTEFVDELSESVRGGTGFGSTDHMKN